MGRRRGQQHARSVCGVCDRDTALRLDGRFFMHAGDGPLGYCRGSQRFPADTDHVHRCPCGAHWDEFGEDRDSEAVSA